MMKQKLLLLVFGIFTTGLLTLTSCSENSNNQEEPEEEIIPKGRLTVQLTDAPFDDPRVEGVFVTVAGISLDEQTYMYEKPMTIELSALTQGQVASIFEQDIDAKEYTTIGLILQMDQDENGEAPAAYVVTEDMVKHNLSTTSEQQVMIELNNSAITIEDGQQKDVVIDFDLRKALVYDVSQEADQFDFQPNLKSALRFISEETFSVEGMVEDQLELMGESVIVYAYPRGSFDAMTETSGELQFMNAIGSSALDENGNYLIHFLPEGDYDLQVANYSIDEDGKLKLESMLNTEVVGGINLGLTTLDANINTDLNILGKLEL